SVRSLYRMFADIRFGSRAIYS
ncbi:transcriptional regulator, partial [Shigella flexneri]|nr:transcriptional regulator [Shigella flexneri]